MKLVETVTHLSLALAVTTTAMLAIPGCSKKDEPPPPMPTSTPAETVAAAPPTVASITAVAPMAPAPGQAPGTLQEAIGIAKPMMKDSSGGPDEGATTLMNYWLQKNYKWSELEAVAQTTGAAFLGSPDAVRGQRICGAGAIQTFSKVSDTPKQHEATIATPEGVLAVGAVMDVTGMKQGGNGRFCGVASGIQTMTDASGAQVRAIRLTGMFDTPANRGATGGGGGPGNLKACCQALQQNSVSMPPPNNVYAAAAANYCFGVVATAASKDAAVASIRGMLRGAPLPSVCR
jgi:hypothetical protein